MFSKTILIIFKFPVTIFKKLRKLIKILEILVKINDQLEIVICMSI